MKFPAKMTKCNQRHLQRTNQPRPRGFPAWAPARVQVIFLSLEQLHGLGPAAIRLDARQNAGDDMPPLAEVVDATVDLLHPGAAVMRREREVG